MVINNDDWVKMSEVGNIYYHYWAKAPTIIGHLEQVVRGDLTGAVKYYVINIGQHSVRIHSDPMLKCLQYIDKDECIRIDYQGSKTNQTGDRVYTLFEVYRKYYRAEVITGLYDIKGELIEDPIDCFYLDDDPIMNGG